MSYTRDWQGKTQGNVGIKLLIWFFKIFPLTAGYFLLWFIIPFYLLFARKGYKSIYYYFRRRIQLPPFKAFLKTFRNHYLFGQIMLDRIALFAGKRNVFQINIKGNEILTDLIKQKKGGILLSSHIGNFEIAGYLFNMGEAKMYGLIFGEENKNWQKYRSRILSKNNIILIPVLPDLSHMFTIINILKHGEFVGMPGDRSFHGTRIHKCEFMGQQASFPTGAYTMAEKLNVPVLSFFVMKNGRFEYNIYIKQIEADSIPQKVEKFVSEIENQLKNYPEQWFNFYDFWNDIGLKSA
jgi:predicted LPLAT superfamily acyltransferase